MGVIKINGVTYGGGDNSVMLTQAEYDALVEAGTVDPTVLYMITDRNQSGGTYASGVIYDNTESGLDATNVQNAIDELAETGGGAGVSVLTYAEYQELVDAGEVNPDISYYISDSNTTGTNYAAGISYDNTESGMAATDVQEAIDEVAPVKASISNIDNVTLTTSDNNKLLGSFVENNEVVVRAVDLFASDTVSISSGVTANKVQLLKYGKVVFLTMAIKVSSPSSWQVIGTIPSAYYPKHSVFGVMINTTSVNNLQTAHINVEPDGRIRLANTLPDSRDTYTFDLTWIIE